MKKTVCPGCSCLCDDVLVSIATDQIQIEPSCQLATDWFRAAQSDRTQPLSKTELATRVRQATKTLADAKAPLITGLNHLSTSAQGRAWELADFSGAMIDIGFSNTSRADALAFQQHGKVTATIGEISSRADLIICWFCDPLTTHPRLLDRIRDKHPKKKLLVFDSIKTKTASIADEFFEIRNQDRGVVLQILRAVVANEKIDFESITKQLPFREPQFLRWASLLTGAKYGTVFLGTSISSTSTAENNPCFDSQTDLWFRLVRELNNHTKFVLSSLRQDRNGLSAQNTLTSLTGFPFAISHLERQQKFDWLEFSTTNVLNRSQCDLLLYFGSSGNLKYESQKSLSPLGQQHLQSIQKILVSPAVSHPNDNIIHLPVSIPGWNGNGDFVRHDDVPIPLRPVTHSELLSASDVLQLLIEHCSVA